MHTSYSLLLRVMCVILYYCIIQQNLRARLCAREIELNLPVIYSVLLLWFILIVNVRPLSISL